MKDQEVIGKIPNGCYQSIIRQIIFDSDTSIDWSNAERIIRDEMPELSEKN